MKTIIFALSIIMGLTLNQNSENSYDYDKAWETVEKFINEGLPKSALEKVEEIHKTAIAEKKDDQLVKSIIYLVRLTIPTDEKGIEISLDRLQKLEETSTPPVKQIAASYLAELYLRYFENFRWEISQRSDIAGEKSKDFRTWTTQQFLTTIETLYLRSLDDKKSIDISIDVYKIVLNKYDSTAVTLRPTLYELLADRTITFFNNYDSYSNENPESFQVDQSWYFGPSKDFVSQEIKAQDKSSPKYKIVSLFQDILKTQLDKKNNAALADYDLKRLTYIYQQSTLEDKEDLYTKALKNLAQNHQDISYHTEIIAVLAYQIRTIQDDSLANIKSVSYTHLDVYKRQVLCRA